MTHLEDLHLAALLHDIGKFRMRHTQPNKRHQEHSYEFVSQEFFSSCGTAFTDAIRHHHPEHYPGCPPDQLQYLIEKQVILADRLSASEREDEEREREDFALVSPMSRLTGSTNNEYCYPLTALTLDRNTIIPKASVEGNQQAYTALWQDFIEAFGTLTENATYAPAAHYQTIVALLRKYTARMPSSQHKEHSDPDISLYDHLRTTAAIAACIGRELTEAEDVEAQLDSPKDPERKNQKICALIKGDISGIQNFLYEIPSDGAARQLRGRSFYIQLLTEVIAHYVLRTFKLPITNLILSSGGHFYILAPYTETETKLDALRQSISEKLWTLHKGDIACLLASTPITADDFAPTHFPDKWRDVSTAVHPRKQRKWSELGHQAMFENLFEPSEKKSEDWKFDTLGRELSNAAFLVTFDVPEQPIPETPEWQSTFRAFGSEIHICTQTDPTPTAPPGTKRATVYSLGDQDFLKDTAKFQWQGIPVSYDFTTLPQVIAHNPDGDVADYDDLANASKGTKWLGALRMDVDDLGTVFSNQKIGNATLSRLATLSDALRLFFEGYVPELCRAYNAEQPKEILELIYAGGDDLFLVGGWSALPEIAEKLRSEFRAFVTGNHVTLSGGIAIEHRKYPLYQFAEQSGEAEKDAKRLSQLNTEGKPVKKNAISFLRTPMSWEDFDYVSKWHQTFLGALTTDRPLPHGMLTRLNQIYSPQELKGSRWAWRSLYYFSRLEDRYQAHHDFIEDLRRELNQASPDRLKKFIDVVTRWTALKIRETQ